MVNVEFIFFFAILRSLSPNEIVHFVILIAAAGQNAEDLNGDVLCQAEDLEGKFSAREKNRYRCIVSAYSVIRNKRMI